MMWILIALPAGAQALLVLRLVSTGLAKRYPFFTTWMAFSAISLIALLAFSSPQSPGYREVWLGRQAITMILLFGALVELTNRILEHYPGLRRVTASGLFGLLLATSIVATAGESFDKTVQILLIAQSAWNGAMCAYVIVLVSLATYLDPRRRQNVILHERVFAASCALTAVFLLMAALNQSQKEISSWVGAAGGVLFPLWWMRMTPAGEVDRRPPVIIGISGNSMADTEARLERLERLVTRSGD
jgi:hypothetical protein